MSAKLLAQSYTTEGRLRFDRLREVVSGDYVMEQRRRIGKMIEEMIRES